MFGFFNKKKYDVDFNSDEQLFNFENNAEIKNNNIFFNVPSAGKIALGTSPHTLSGSAAGFSFAVSWGKYGYVGGTIGRNEAKRLA